MAAGQWNPPDAMTFDDETPSGFLLITLDIDKLKVSTFGSKPNADVTCNFHERSLQVTCKFKKDEKPYFYEVKKLPDNVVPGESKWKCEKGKIKIHLKKAEAGSWSGMLRTRGIEHHDAEEAS